MYTLVGALVYSNLAHGGLMFSTYLIPVPKIQLVDPCKDITFLSTLLV